MRTEVYTAVEVDIYFPTARLILRFWLKIVHLHSRISQYYAPTLTHYVDSNEAYNLNI
jgi:hypothetical protein